MAEQLEFPFEGIQKMEDTQKDRLSKLFVLQRKFMDLLGIPETECMTLETREKQIAGLILAIHCECDEILDEKQKGIQWKPWREYKDRDLLGRILSRQYVVEELIDILHFFLEICILMQVGPGELFQEYEKKMKINIGRQASGY